MGKNYVARIPVISGEFGNYYRSWKRLRGCAQHSNFRHFRSMQRPHTERRRKRLVAQDLRHIPPSRAIPNDVDDPIDHATVVGNAVGHGIAGPICAHYSRSRQCGASQKRTPRRLGAFDNDGSKAIVRFGHAPPFFALRARHCSLPATAPGVSLARSTSCPNRAIISRATYAIVWRVRALARHYPSRWAGCSARPWRQTE